MAHTEAQVKRRGTGGARDEGKKLLESASESVNDHLRLRHDYLVVEHRIVRSQIDRRVQLTDSERQELAAIGAKLGKKALAIQARRCGATIPEQTVSEVAVAAARPLRSQDMDKGLVVLATHPKPIRVRPLRNRRRFRGPPHAPYRDAA